MSAERRIRPMGDRAVLVELASPGEVMALHRALAAAPPTGVEELVPAARTILVRFDPSRTAAAALRDEIDGAEPDAIAPASAAEVVLEVAYDGPDLRETAALLDVSAPALVARHTETVWRVAFTGFAPGFGYLLGDDWPFDVPRLPTPRTRVPAGAVGLAGAFSGAYPRATPGGWRLVGTTDARLFDPGSAHPVLLTPGTAVRFRPRRAASTSAASSARAPRAEPREDGATSVQRRQEDQAPSQRTGAIAGPGAEDERRGLRIERAGNVTVQDLGRPGLAHLGIARSGVLDRTALRLANRLVGNAEDAAVLEVAPGGLAAVARSDLWIALTGTWAPLRIAGRSVDAYRAHLWPAGETLDIGWPSRGARAVLAVRGGIEVPPVLGSRSTDTLAHLGPERLRPGDELPVGTAPATPVPPLDAGPWGWPPARIELRMRPGPRVDWFAPEAWTRLTAGAWTVSTAADRVGVRLEGPALPRIRHEELPSEGMVPGAVQVPPAGGPVVLLADGPVTGGYPVIAVVAEASLDALAQAAPGSTVVLRAG